MKWLLRLNANAGHRFTDYAHAYAVPFGGKILNMGGDCRDSNADGSHHSGRADDSDAGIAGRPDDCAIRHRETVSSEDLEPDRAIGGQREVETIGCGNNAGHRYQDSNCNKSLLTAAAHTNWCFAGPHAGHNAGARIDCGDFRIRRFPGKRTACKGATLGVLDDYCPGAVGPADLDGVQRWEHRYGTDRRGVDGRRA